MERTSSKPEPRLHRERGDQEKRELLQEEEWFLVSQVYAMRKRLKALNESEKTTAEDLKHIDDLIEKIDLLEEWLEETRGNLRDLDPMNRPTLVDIQGSRRATLEDERIRLLDEQKVHREQDRVFLKDYQETRQRQSRLLEEFTDDMQTKKKIVLPLYGPRDIFYLAQHQETIKRSLQREIAELEEEEEAQNRQQPSGWWAKIMGKRSAWEMEHGKREAEKQQLNEAIKRVEREVAKFEEQKNASGLELIENLLRYMEEEQETRRKTDAGYQKRLKEIEQELGRLRAPSAKQAA